MKAGWEVKALGEVCTKIGSGATPRGGNEAYKDEGISLIRSLNVHDLEFRPKDLALIDDEQAEALSNVEVCAGDVLLNITGASVARCCVAPIEVLPARVNQHVSILRPKAQMLSTEFLAYLLVSKEIKDILLGIGDESGSTRQALTKAQLQAFRIPLPPLDEQKRIVEVLDAAFEGLSRARAHTETNLQNARELFESVARDVFSRAEQGWNRCSVGDVLTLQRGIDITKRDQSSGIVPVVSSGGIKSFHSVAHSSGPGVIIGRKGSIGSVYFVDQDYWPHDTTLWVKDFKGNDPKLVFYLLRGLRLAELDTGTANPSLNRNLVHPLEITWPEASLQAGLVAELDAAEAHTAELQSHYLAKLADLDALRQALLQKAFAGELK